ncbi:hypothetical protein TSUD_337810 [Trifolium subterraneum]|uniref:Uncharacterized protein n=1 Tax=Trifolium subterraneum TaxID=3900 RepID=A0A2Z6MPA6_TRISU|nr:hypothetical protein TSUD_337810 [Trifolium subterraneum]
MTPELQHSAEDENQKGFQHPSVSNLVKSVTNEPDLPRKSPTTVLFSQDQIYTENFHNEPYMAHESSTSQTIPGSLPGEADAISMESDADERINAVNSAAAEVSHLEHWNISPNPSNDFNNVNPVTVLERQSPIVGSDIMQSDIRVFEDPQTLNQVIDIDNSMNISTHLAQLHNVETDTVTCDRIAVPEVRQWCSIVNPVCVESTTSEFAECPLPYRQLSHANLMQLPQSLSASPSFMEDLSRTVMPLDRVTNHNCLRESVEILQGLCEPVELVNSSPVILEPSSYAPGNENASHDPHNINNPGYMNSDPFQAHYLTSQMPYVADPNTLLFEMERIQKMNEEAVMTYEKKKLQLQSDYEKEVEMLRAKHYTLLQNVDTAAALKKIELEAHRDIVFRNMILADVWSRTDSIC